MAIAIQDTGFNGWHAVFTVKLGELIDFGVFDWSKDELDWSDAAYSPEQYSRICDYFIERFKFREISIVPALEWFNILKRKLVYELCPKYNELYKAVEEGYNPIANEDEYYKERTISSEYPETMLSGNSDYISSGVDREWERIKVGNTTDAFEQVKKQHSVDEMMLDELECMFIGLYTANVNGF